jgi:hypothetical protein
VVFLRGYGVRKVGEPEKIEPDTSLKIRRSPTCAPAISTICAAQQKTEITSDRVNAALAQLDPLDHALHHSVDDFPPLTGRGRG